MAELAFRLRQEIANLRFLASPPSLRKFPSPALGLPDPAPVIERLRDTRFAREVIALADRVVEHRFLLFGMEVSTGPDIAWRRDTLHGIETPPWYFRRIPYLDFTRAGDHKVIWELNRHQHLVILAQAYRFTGRGEYLREIVNQLESWFVQNPPARGINWASALEVAFRVFSWIWALHLTGSALTPGFYRRFVTELYRHGCYLESNLSIYFSPNTHLLGEAVVLHALGALFPQFPRSGRWRRLGTQIVRRELQRQILPDGAYFEQSTYYHVYAFDLLLFHYLVARKPADFEPVLAGMAAYLDAILGPDRNNPQFGDDDGGRVFHPYGDRAAFGRATLAACSVALGRGDWSWAAADLWPIAAWWIGASALDTAPPAARETASILFPDSGMAVLCRDQLHVLVDAGSFGPGSAGHSHSDTLSLVVRHGETEILVDAGTFTYVADRRRRDWFRGSSAHNTVRIDGLSQAEPAGPFRWISPPSTRIHGFERSPDRASVDAECRYQGLLHRRRVVVCSPVLLIVVDDIEGAAGEHIVEQFWHPGQPVTKVSDHCYRIGSGARITFAAGATVTSGVGEEHGWRSRVFGSIEPAPWLLASYRGALPVRLAAAIEITPSGSSAVLAIEDTGLRYEGTNIVLP
jgi:hypothetical protein